MKRFLAIMALLLAVVMSAWATNDVITLTIDLARKKVTSSAVMAIRETVPVRLVNIGPAAPSNLVLRITDGLGVTYAMTEAFASGGSYTSIQYGVTSVLSSATGNLDLNTSELVSFFSNRAPSFVRSFWAGVWDVAENRLLVSDAMQIQNNPWRPDMPGPSPVGTHYLAIDPDTTPQNGFVVQYSGGVWAPVDPAAMFAAVSLDLSQSLAGKADSNLVWSTFAKLSDLPPPFDPAALESNLAAEVSARIAGDAAAQSNLNAVAASIPDVSGFATTDQVAAVAGQIPDISHLASTDQVAAVEALIPDVSSFATTDQVAAVAALIPDVSGYATTDQVAAVQALIPDVSPFLKGNSIGSFTNLPLASLVQTASNRWEFGGWTVVGTYTNGMISLTETNAHYIQTPPFAAGVSEIGGSYLYGIGATALDVDYYTEAGGWVSNYVSQRAVYTGYMGISAALAGSTSNALQPSLRLRYAGYILPPLVDDSVAGGIYLTNLAIRGWSQSAYVGQTNDNAGMLALVDDNITADARAAVNQRTLDSTRSQLQNAIDGIDPSLAGVDLNYNPLRFNHLWRARQTNETLEFAFDGAPMFELTGGGTVTPQIVAMSMSGPTVTVVVASATAWRPWLEYTTNLFTGWELAATNLYTSTWPDLVNGTYTLGYTSIYPQAYYRVVATSTNATDGYAKFYVPLQAAASAMTDFPNYLARTSALSAYLPLAGGTITGKITIGPADNPLKIMKNYSGGIAIDIAITNSSAGAIGIVINDGSSGGVDEYLSLRRHGSTQYGFSRTQATFNVSVVSTSRVQGASLGIGTNTLSESGGRLAFNGANLATDAMLSNATANAQAPVTGSRGGTLTIDLGAKPLHSFSQVGPITNIVLDYDTNKVTHAEVLLYANGSAITWPTNNVTWKPSIPDATSNKWQSILFRAHRGKVQAAYVESYD